MDTPVETTVNSQEVSAKTAPEAIQIATPAFVDQALPSQLTPVRTPTQTREPMKAPVKSEIIINPQVKQTAPVDMPFDTELFRHRIYLKDWSHFAGEDYLMVNPEELRPENEPRLTSKLLKHYSVKEPSYFDFQPRMSIAVALASFVPLPSDTRKRQALKELTDIYLESKTGKHPEDAKQFSRYQNPFAAHIKLWRDPKEEDLMESAFGKLSMTLYLIVNEALKAKGRELEASGYLDMPMSADHAIAQLAPKLDVTPQQMSDALMNGGPDGLAQLLGVKQQTVNEIRQVAEFADKLEFANNVVANWNIGRSVEGMDTRTVEEKIKVGLMVRTANKLQALKGIEFPAVKPRDLQVVEERVLSRLRQMPQELQEALYYTGTEIALTSNRTVETLFGFPVPALGLHNHVPFVRGEAGGLRQLYVGSMYAPPSADNTLVHEAHHLLFPKSFNETEIAEMEALVAQNSRRMSGLEQALTKWETTKSPDERRQIEAAINQTFTVGDMTLEKALGGKITDAGMRTLRNFVYDAHKNLDPHSDVLARGYATPEMRATEMISRYSELKYVRSESRPEMLQFIAPEIGVVYDRYYLKHLRDQVAQLKENQREYPAHMQYIGFPGITGKATPPAPAGTQHSSPLPATIAQASTLKLVDHPTRMVAAPSTEPLEAGHAKKGLHASFAGRLEAMQTAIEEQGR